jgi:DNA-binding transcriptional MerR regulator
MGKKPVASIGQMLARSPHRAVEASDLVSQTVTVSDLAEALAPIAPDVDGTIQRIRHWTREDVLLPVAFRHAGAGKYRQYSPAAIYNAAVLHVLTAAGLPISQSRFLSELMQHVSEFALQWIMAPDRRAIIGSGRFTVAVTVKGEIRIDRDAADAPDTVLAVVVDLVKLFTQVDHAAGRSREQRAAKAKG